MLPLGLSNSLIPNELSELDSDFVNAFGKPAGLWFPCDKHGARTPDFSGNLNYGTLNGGVTVQPGGWGVFGQSWNFDGTSGYINLGTGLNKLNRSFSVMCAGIIASSQDHAIFCSGTSGGFLFEIQSSGKLRILQSGSASIVVGNTAISLNTPFVAACTIDASGNIVMYLNGISDSTGSTAVTFSSASFSRIGENNSNFWYHGQIYAVAVTGYLSAAQVSSLYQSLLTGEPYKLFQGSSFERLYSPSSGTTVSLTSKSFVFSLSATQETFDRELNSATQDESDSSGNISFTQELNSSLESQTFSTSATSIERDLQTSEKSQSFSLVQESINKELNTTSESQSNSLAQETISRIIQSTVLAVSFDGALITVSSITYQFLKGTAKSESFSLIQSSIEQGLQFKSQTDSSSSAQETIERDLYTKSLEYSLSSVQETIERDLQSKSQDYSNSLAQISKGILLTSEADSYSFALGKFTTQQYIKFELLSFRRYSSQYFVQSGSVNDSGE